MSDKRICIGEITTVHGIKGAVKVRLFAENIDLFKKPLFIDESSNKTLLINLKKDCDTYWLAEVEGLTDRTEAEKLRGTKLYCNRAELPTPAQGEFYMQDLIGLDVRDESGQKIGHVIAVENFGAEDLLEIQPINGKSFYFPMRDELIPDINTDDHYITVNASEEWKNL